MLLTITPGELLEEPPQIIARGDSHSPYFYRVLVMLNSLLYRYVEVWSGQPKAVKIVKLSIVARVRKPSLICPHRKGNKLRRLPP